MKRYAMGVLGLGTLVLTQLRFEHPAQILEAESLIGVGEEDTDPDPFQEGTSDTT